MRNWNDAEKKVTGIKEGNEFTNIVGDKHISLKDSLGVSHTIQMDVPTVMMDNSINIPYSYLSDTIGYKITWLENERR